MTLRVEDVDEVIDAISALIDDELWQRNPTGTWTGYEDREQVRARLRKALFNLIVKAGP